MLYTENGDSSTSPIPKECSANDEDYTKIFGVPSSDFGLQHLKKTPCISVPPP